LDGPNRSRRSYVLSWTMRDILARAERYQKDRVGEAGARRHEIAWEFAARGGSYTGRMLIDGEIYTPSEATKKFLQTSKK
jgi:hypothetical protein